MPTWPPAIAWLAVTAPIGSIAGFSPPGGYRRAISVPLARVTKGQPGSLSTARNARSAPLAGATVALPKLIVPVRFSSPEPWTRRPLTRDWRLRGTERIRTRGSTCRRYCRAGTAVSAAEPETEVDRPGLSPGEVALLGRTSGRQGERRSGDAERQHADRIDSPRGGPRGRARQGRCGGLDWFDRSGRGGCAFTRRQRQRPVRVRGSAPQQPPC